MGLLELVTTMLLLFCLFRNTVLYVWLTSLQSCYVNMLMVWQGWKKEERVPVLAGEWWITFALALLSRLQHLSLHFLIKTSVPGGLRHLKSVSRMVSRSCQVDQQVKLLGKSRWKPWCAARLCVSRIQTQLLLGEAAEVAASKQAHQLISPLPPPTLHFATLPSSPLLQIPSYLFAHGLTSCTHNKFSREREKSGTHLIDGEIL